MAGAALPPVYAGTTDFFGGWEAGDPEPYEGVLVRVDNVTVDYNAGSGVYWISQSADLEDGRHVGDEQRSVADHRGEPGDQHRHDHGA